MAATQGYMMLNSEGRVYLGQRYSSRFWGILYQRKDRQGT